MRLIHCEIFTPTNSSRMCIFSEFFIFPNDKASDTLRMHILQYIFFLRLIQAVLPKFTEILQAEDDFKKRNW